MAWNESGMQHIFENVDTLMAILPTNVYNKLLPNGMLKPTTVTDVNNHLLKEGVKKLDHHINTLVAKAATNA